MNGPGVIERRHLLGQLRDARPWDVLVIGGGATGLGIAVDAASRGYCTALIDARDFSSGTSSRSTKLV
ncbi:MAG: FAD-dependent oxidoreductase, partial [Burkholderiaceae bacterium]